MCSTQGYGITATLDQAILTVEGHNKATRMALADPREIPDKATLNAPVAIAREQICRGDWKPANAFTNGRIAVHVHGGRVVQLHFRKKQQDGMAELARALGAEV